MRLLLRWVALLALSATLYYLFSVAHASQTGDNPDGSKLVACYAGIVFAGAGLAALLSLWLLPVVGDFIGGFLYSPVAEERHPHADALAKIAVGDYAAAILEYEKRLEEVPEDMMAVNEVVRLYRERLHDPESAAQFLDRMLEYGDWTDYQRGILYERLQEIRVTTPPETDPASQHEL